jgi:hypothetical protein
MVLMIGSVAMISADLGGDHHDDHHPRRQGPENRY